MARSQSLEDPRKRVPTIVQFVESAVYLGLTISPAQRALLKAIYGLAMDEEEVEIYRACTGRAAYAPGHAVNEVTIIAGARSGKDSRIAAPIALYEGIFGDYVIAKGEVGVIPLVAQDGPGAEIAFGYIRDYAAAASRLNAFVDDERMRELLITNARGQRVAIRCFACSAKSIRGWSIPAAVMDEVAFFRVEGGANADAKVQTAIRRGGINFPKGQRLVKISTPYLKGGVLWDDLARYWGSDANPDVLVWKASTALMNPSIAEERIEKERRKDRAAARVEYDAEFAEDVTTFLPQTLLEAAVVDGRRELAPVAGRRYQAAADPSGGTGGGDAFTLAIVHAEERDGRPVMVQDVMKAWRAPRGEKLELALVVGEIAALLARFGLYRLIGDRYAGEWPAQEFRKKSVLYEPAEHDKSAAYIELEPWFSTGAIEMLDHPELVHEAGLLEKRLKPGGKKPTIDHPKGAHDDHPNALALAVAKLAGSLHAPAAMSAGRVDRLGAASTPNTPEELLARGGRAGSYRFWGNGAERPRLSYWR